MPHFFFGDRRDRPAEDGCVVKRNRRQYRRQGRRNDVGGVVQPAQPALHYAEIGVPPGEVQKRQRGGQLKLRQPARVPHFLPVREEAGG